MRGGGAERPVRTGPRRAGHRFIRAPGAPAGMGVSVSGQGVQISLRAKYRTFTPDQLATVLHREGYTSTKATANTSDNPLASPVSTVMHSKGDLIILFGDDENMIKFHIINRRNVSDIFEDEIKKVLTSLNYNPPVVDTMKMSVAATVAGMGSPLKTLKSLVRTRLADHLKEMNDMDNAEATSLKITQYDDERTEFMTTSIEPLTSDPTGTYYVEIEYMTDDNDKFTRFVRRVGDDMIENVVRGAEKHA